MSVYDVIESKIIDYAEVIVLLFDHCNLKCVFCPQIHDDFTGSKKEEILAKVDGVAQWINNNQRSKHFKIHLMGGELFQDYWIEKNYLKIYQEFIDTLKSKITDPTKDIVPNFVTNLVFTKTEPVLDFLKKNNLKISVSYDSVGRFSPKDFELFKDNIELFKPYISMISCVLTVGNIRAVIQGDNYFDYLYDNFLIDWDSFLPSGEDKTNRFLMPKESELFEFYKVLVDKYPNCINIEHFVTEKQQMKMTCTRGNSYTVLKDGTVPKGCSGAAWLKDGSTDDPSTGLILENWFEKYNCFTCEYFAKCPFTCFIKADYKHIDHDLDDCVFRKTFDYVKNKSFSDLQG